MYRCIVDIIIYLLRTLQSCVEVKASKFKAESLMTIESLRAGRLDNQLL